MFNVICFTYSGWLKLCLQKRYLFLRNFHKWSLSAIMSFNTTLKTRAMQNVGIGAQEQEMLLRFLYYDQLIWFRTKLINDLSSQQLSVESPVFNYISKGSCSDLKSKKMLSQAAGLKNIPLSLTSDSCVSSATVCHPFHFIYWHRSSTKGKENCWDTVQSWVVATTESKKAWGVFFFKLILLPSWNSSNSH